MERFKRLGIIEPILKSIEEQRFRKPTTIQEKSVPLVLAGKDVIAGSATGSGKTLAFGSGIIQVSRRGDGIQSLVLTPTRELAEQVSKALSMFSRHKPLNIIAVYGGVSINPQIDGLKEADVVVGTPGRILDHMERNTINLSRVKVLVLDEADRMLDMGFIDDVQRIINRCPRNRQTLLFSATITSGVARLSKRYMRGPVRVSADTYVDPRKLRQVYYDVSDNMKFSTLVHLLKHEHKGLVMVFCNTRMNTDFVANNLKYSGIQSMAIHGGFSQDKRTRVMKQFNSRDVYVLVCTDVAARGLDIKGVSHVYNYDIPKDPKEYIHRIGRTARAGKEGKVINILSPRDHENFRRVLRENEIDMHKEHTPYVKRAVIGQKDKPRYRKGNFRGGPRGHRHRK
jgi:ATP-dependent RNA helicase DeaD